jgi:ketosteroid isomerase-like protein
MKHSTRVKAAYWTMAAASGLVLTGVVVADSASTTQQSVRAEIIKKLGQVTTALTRGDPAEQVTKMMYADDVLIVEPGRDSPLSRGIPAATKAVQEWMDDLGPGGVKSCHFTVIDPVVSSANTFSSWLNLLCKASPSKKEDSNARLLYVWRKTPDGWRVTLEAVEEGKF